MNSGDIEDPVRIATYFSAYLLIVHNPRGEIAPELIDECHILSVVLQIGFDPLNGVEFAWI